MLEKIPTVDEISKASKISASIVIGAVVMELGYLGTTMLFNDANTITDAVKNKLAPPPKKSLFGNRKNKKRK